MELTSNPCHCTIECGGPPEDAAVFPQKILEFKGACTGCLKSLGVATRSPGNAITQEPWKPSQLCRSLRYLLYAFIRNSELSSFTQALNSTIRFFTTPKMPASNGNGLSQSNIACHMCRKRKIKCSRELPQCSICQESSQSCTYPRHAGRPGPKIGSSQAGRKRHQLSNNEEDPEIRTKRRPGRPRREEESQENEKTNMPVSSPGNSMSSVSSYRHINDIQSLSFIVHPSHESCSPEEEFRGGEGCTAGAAPAAADDESMIATTCFLLKINSELLDQLIDVFFQTFTSFRLFREPVFRRKLESMTSNNEANALVAAMLAFAFKSTIFSQSNLDSATPSKLISETYLSELAESHIDAALKECGDDPPSLSLLQALILMTHWLLIRGVRGRAWRSLGTCVRIAYELNLHLIDSGKTLDHSLSNQSRWCEDEERRRAWWAIWEMDVFASVIRRCPTAIDWSQNETLLPAEDEKWFQGEPQASSYLEVRLVDRWKALQASGNQSPKAWFIVVNSLVKEAQATSSPIGINRSSSINNLWKVTSSGSGKTNSRNIETDGSVFNKLSTLNNTLRCFSIALPVALKYRNQYLSFGTGSSDTPGTRHLHSAIYSIHMLTLLTKLMIHKYHIFRTGPRWNDKSSNPDIDEADGKDGKFPDSSLSKDRIFDQYFEAADEVLSLLHSSSEDQYKFVNPFLANTIWLASAVQLLHRELASNPAEEDLVNSNLEVLRMTYEQFVVYWSMPKVLSQNLDTLAKQLKIFKDSQEEEGTSENQRTKELAEFETEQNALSARRVHGTQRLALNGQINKRHWKSNPVQPSNSARSHFRSATSAGLSTGISSAHPENRLSSDQVSLQELVNYAQQLQQEDQSYARSQFQQGNLEASSGRQGNANRLANYTPLNSTAMNLSFFPNTSSGEEQLISTPGFLNDFDTMRELGFAGGLELSSHLDEILSGSCMESFPYMY